MKKIIIVATSLLLVFTLSGCDDLGSYADEEKLELLEEVIEDELVNDSLLYTEEWGSVSALSTDTLTLESMLVYAIEDEYSAYAEYEYILANFDVTKPFSNIINAEASHIEMLLPHFDTYELVVPYNDAQNHLLHVIDIEDTFRTGVLAEILNIDMYNLFLEQKLPDDVRDTFIALRDASIKHLAAFEKNLAKYE
jgi:rubrerythrin